MMQSSLSRNMRLRAMIAQSFRELRTARAQCAGAPSGQSTAAKLKSEIAAREKLLESLSAIRALLARHMAEDAAPVRSVAPSRRRNHGRGIAARTARAARTRRGT